MDDVVRTTFSDAVAHMSDELGSMPLSRWNESVFRYFFCRRLAASYPDVAQFVECDHVDLVLHGSTEKAFIEFKFYLRQQKFDPYSGSSLGFKGGPGPRILVSSESALINSTAEGRSLDCPNTSLWSTPIEPERRWVTSTRATTTTTVIRTR